MSSARADTAVFINNSLAKPISANTWDCLKFGELKHAGRSIRDFNCNMPIPSSLCRSH